MVFWFFNITSLSPFNLFNYIKMLPCKRSRCSPHVSQNSKGEVGSCYFLLRVVWSLPVVIRLLCSPVTVARGLWRNCERKKPRAAWSSCCWHSLSSSGGMSWVGTLSDDHLEMKQLCCGWHKPDNETKRQRPKICSVRRIDNKVTFPLPPLHPTPKSLGKKRVKETKNHGDAFSGHPRWGTDKRGKLDPK